MLLQTGGEQTEEEFPAGILPLVPHQSFPLAYQTLTAIGVTKPKKNSTFFGKYGILYIIFLFFQSTFGQ